MPCADTVLPTSDLGLHVAQASALINPLADLGSKALRKPSCAVEIRAKAAAEGETDDRKPARSSEAQRASRGGHKALESASESSFLGSRRPQKFRPPGRSPWKRCSAVRRRSKTRSGGDLGKPKEASSGGPLALL